MSSFTRSSQDQIFLRPHKAFRGLVTQIINFRHRRAMASGSFPAIYKMLTILESQDEMVGKDFSPAYHHQFEEEYNIKIAPESRREAGKFASPTAEDLHEEEEFLRRRYAIIANFEHLARYPLMF
ncbi:hypothetical protein K438DRAFT_1765536 [Mycena galopus ATCC 62051]|nr:hypothetical protein K438DRAFT_1765536 [Mycena galopus ATCC 62051]